MKLQLNPSIATQAVPGGAPAGKSPDAPAGTSDGIQISVASTLVNQLSAERSAKIERVTASVQGGSYQVSSAETSSSIVEHALTGPN